MNQTATITLKNFSACYGQHEVLQNINISIAANEVLAIIGESGAGKTTLGLATIGLSQARCQGSILFNNMDLLRLECNESRQIRGKDIAMVFQNSDQVLHPLYTALDQVTEAVTAHFAVDKDYAMKKSEQALQNVGLPIPKHRNFPHQLSGGERQRVLLAMALVNEPTLLLMDEPTSSLDPLSKSAITAFLKKALAERTGLLITHDLATASQLADNIAVLYHGRIIEYGSCADIISSPAHPYTRALLRAYPDLTTYKDLQGIPGKPADVQTGCVFQSRCSQNIDICFSHSPSMHPLSGRHSVACHRGGIIPILQATNINKSFDDIPVLEDISLTLYEGETLSLIGESGSGKTTLARILMGLWPGDSGEITLDGKKELPRRQFYERIQMIHQNPGEALSHRMSLKEIVREPLDIHKRGNIEERDEKVRKAMLAVELPIDDEFSCRFPHQISGGEAQRLAIARALVLEPKVLIADEITSSLDAGVQARIIRLLLSLQETRGLALLFITHDLALARKVSDRVIVLQQGKIVESGLAFDVLVNPASPYTQQLLAAAPRLQRS